jgi:hypothetical protein
MKNHILYTFDPFDDYPWEKSVQESYADGCRIFSFLYPLMIAWQKDGSYDFTLLDQLTDRIINLIPEGSIMPRTFLTTPYWWDQKYPQELLKFSGPTPKQTDFQHVKEPLWRYENKMFHGSDNASLASLQWKEDAGNAVYAAVKHLVERYGRNKIYAMQMAYGTCGEWGQFGSYLFGQTANADFSEPMVKAYREYLKNKYGNKSEFATILPPSKAARQIAEVGMLRTPKSIQYCTDYAECVAQVKNQALAHFCRKAKEACSDMVCGSFGGNAMGIGSSAYTLNQHGGSERKHVLEIKELDFLSTPNVYFNQRKGATYSQVPVKSNTQYKRFIAECDTRSELANNPWAPAKGFSGDQFLQETAFNLLTSEYLWHYDFGLNWYSVPEVRKIRQKIYSLDPKLFDSSVQAEIAVVIDPNSVACTSGSVGYYRQFNETLTKELSCCGAFADHITIDDIEKLAPYKLYIFRDAFLYRPQLRKFLEENNASALWLGPAGCVTENSIDFSLAEKQTTFKLKHAHQVVAPNTVTCHGEHFLNKGLTLPATPSGVEDINALWTPVLYAEADSASQVAGLVESLDLPGLISRKSGNRFDVWSSSPLLFQETLRNLAIAAGVNLRVLEGKAEIYGAGKTFAIHVKSDSPIVLQANNNLINLITDEVYPAIDNKVTINEPSGRVLLLRE